jgi:hypothetical protein
MKEATTHAEETGHLLTVHGVVGLVERLHGATLMEVKTARRVND